MNNESAMPESSQTAPRRRPDLVTGSITRSLLRFALPMLGANLLQSVNGSINAIWVGRFLGNSALAATANANLVMFLMFSGVFGLSTAAAMLIGQHAGRRDIRQVRRIVGTASGLFVAGGVVVAALGWWLAPYILSALVTPADVFPLAMEYLRIEFLLMPSIFVFILLMMALRATGDSLTPLWFMGLSAALDAALNPLLIAGPGWFPKMGIGGAATASLIANYVSCSSLLAYVYAKDLPIRLRGSEWRYLVPDRAILRTVVSTGVPMALQSLVMTLSGLAVMGLVNRHGSTVAAAYAATSQLWTYIQMPAFALAAAVSAMAAQNIGAGRWDRIGAIHRSGLIIALLTMSLLAAAMLMLDHFVLGLFLDARGEGLRIAERIDRIGIWSLVLFGVTAIPGAIVRANGAALVPLIVLAVSFYPIRLGFALGLEPHLGEDAIWWSLNISAMAALALTFGYYRWGRWRRLKLLPDAAAAAAQTAALPGA
jgi:putative MATE family efflux protein